MWNAPKLSPSSDSGDSVPHVPLKTQVPQKPIISNTQPSPEPIQTQIKKSLSDALLFPKRISQKEFFNRYPDHQEEVETLLKQIEGIGRIRRKDGWIYSVPACKFRAKDKVEILEGDFKNYHAEVERYNCLNSEQIHTYIITIDKAWKKEPLICSENQLRPI